MDKKKYDKKTIKKVKDKGLFDNKLDPAILDQSAEERAKLQKALAEDRKKQESKGKGTKVKSSPLKKKTRKKASKPSIFMRMIYFFQALFFGKKTPHNSRFLLKREMKAVIESFNPVFYDFNIQKIKENFPEYIYSIYKGLQSLAHIFEELFREEKDLDFTKRIFFLELVDQLLSDSDKKLLDSINEDYFQQIIAQEPYPEEALNKRLNELRNNLERSDKQVILQYTAEVEKFLYLFRFPFSNFFKVFDSHFTVEASYKPKFQPVFGDKGIEEIKKLDEYFRLIDFDRIAENIFVHIDQTVNDIKDSLKPKEDDGKDKSKDKKPPQTDIPVKYKYSSDSLRDLHGKLSRLNKKKILESMIKLMTEQFDYEPGDVKYKGGLIFKQYLKLTLAKKMFLFRQSFDRIKAEIVQREILMFFEVSSLDELQSIQNYSTEVNDKLTAKGTGGLHYVIISAIFKTFYEKMYKPQVKPFVNILLIEGEFIKKHESTLFAEAYYGIERVMEQFHNMEFNISTGEGDMNDILRFANGGMPEGTFLTLVQRKIGDLETKIRKNIVDGCNHYKSILEHTKMALEDMDSGTRPKFVSNVKIMASKKEFVLGLQKGVERLAKILDLIMGFQVMQGSVD
ncbi:MAG: DUF5312 domain-containing protein [Spirochaetota bacterium]|nr:DUF5312 domain-containing protein [Spirochaetota bacterium]